jgi:hypothetical protein
MSNTPTDHFENHHGLLERVNLFLLVVAWDLLLSSSSFDYPYQDHQSLLVHQVQPCLD